MIPDIINGTFEFTAGWFAWLNCRQVLRDKQVKGVSVVATTFFTSWGCWNLFYYPHLGQWCSFAGGLSIVIVNSIYVVLLSKYKS